MRALGIGVLLAAGLTAQPAFATYSVAASDTQTLQTGAAGTSCLMGGAVVSIIYGAAPGAGTVLAQATFSQRGRDEAVRLLAEGTSPDEIIEAITLAGFDRQTSSRQYAVVDLQGRVAAFTGSATLDFAGDRQGSFGEFTYSVQGNILTGEAVLRQAAAAFEAGGCDLAERLMNALEAGARDGRGDSRCTDMGIPSDSAFVQVEAPDRAVGGYLAIEVPASGRNNPVTSLRERFDAWRGHHPCTDAVAPETSAAFDAGMELGDADAPDEDVASGDRATVAPGSGCGVEGGRAQLSTAWFVLTLCLAAVLRRRRSDAAPRLRDRVESCARVPCQLPAQCGSWGERRCL